MLVCWASDSDNLITCREFEHDHQGFKPLRYDVWAEENKVLKDIVTQSADMVRELLINSDEIEEDSIGLRMASVKRRRS